MPPPKKTAKEFFFKIFCFELINVDPPFVYIAFADYYNNYLGQAKLN
jgi:hypothetical protein